MSLAASMESPERLAHGSALGGFVTTTTPAGMTPLATSRQLTPAAPTTNTTNHTTTTATATIATTSPPIPPTVHAIDSRGIPTTTAQISSLNPRSIGDAYQHVRLMQAARVADAAHLQQQHAAAAVHSTPTLSSLASKSSGPRVSFDLSPAGTPSPDDLSSASEDESRSTSPLPIASVGSTTTASNSSASPAPIVSVHHAQSEMLRLQAENTAAKDEIAALRQRLKQLEEIAANAGPAAAAAVAAAHVPTISHASTAIGASSHHSTHSHAHAEQEALAAWQQSQALDLPLPLMKHVQAFDAEPFLRNGVLPTNTPAAAALAASVESLQTDVGNLLDYLKPSKRSESRRANVLAFLKLLVRKSLGAQVYPLGAYALKTYVGQEEVMDVSAFFSRAHENTWLHRIVNALCQEASSSHHNTNNIHATTTQSPHYAVSRLSVSFNKTRPYINCCIGGVHVNIFGNALAGLSHLALLERMDLLCAQEHLFKRTIILVRCWAIGKRILNLTSPSATSDDDVTTQIPVEGLLSGIFLRTLVLYIFNAHSSSITTPLEGLYRLLHFLKDFDWDEYAVTIYGAVTIASLEQVGCQAQSKWEYVARGPSAWPTGTKPFMPIDTWKQYRLAPKETRATRPPPGAFLTRSASAAAGMSLATSGRSNSDSNLASLPARTLKPATRTMYGNSLGATQGTPPHSQSYSSLVSLVDHPSSTASHGSHLAPPTGSSSGMRHSLHSHSFSNLASLKQYAPVPEHSRGLRANNAERDGDSFEFTAYTPADTPHDSASLTPAHSHVDLQQLLNSSSSSSASSVIHQPVGASAAAARMGFAAGALPPSVPLRSSSSAKQLSRLPQPVASASSFFFSSPIDDGFSDGESPDFDDDETHGRLRRVGSAASFDGEESLLEGAEYLDIGGSHLASPIADDDAHANLAYPSDDLTATVDSSASPAPAHGDPHLFTRCSLNVLDPIDATHNLGVSISYKHEYHIRKVLQEGFYALKNSIQKYHFQQASKREAAINDSVGSELDTTADRTAADLELHPVVMELFEEAQLSRYKEQMHRENKHRKMVAAASSNSLSAALGGTASASPTLAAVGSSSTLPSLALGVTHGDSLWSSPLAVHPEASTLDQVFQQAPGPFSSSAFSISSASVGETDTSVGGSLFAFDGLTSPAAAAAAMLKSVTISPPRAIGTSASFSSLNPNSTHFVPTSATSATAPIIVDDLAPPALAGGMSTSASSTAIDAMVSAAPPSVFDTLSGDFDKIVANLDHARQFETPDLTEDQLVHLIIDLLKERVSVPVGRMGSLLHDATNNHSLPAMLKEHYGGLKRLLERHTDIFQVGRDHPYNPAVQLKPKWYNFAPPRPITSNAIGSSASLNGTSGLMVGSGSSGNLQAMANGVGGADGNNRRKLQRRRTRTRRTNSSTATAASTAVAQAVRSGLMPDPSHLANMQVGSSILPHPRAAVTPIVALDCEMVGVGPSGFTSMLARISIINFVGEVLYDKFVLPTETITDYRTSVSGILPHHLETGVEFRQVQREVSQIVKNRIMVGHGLMADLQALCIVIPKHQLRDTAVFKLFCPHRPLPLKQLVKDHLSHVAEFHHFQEFQHNPIHDARAALALYKLVQQQWETMVMQESQQLGHAQHSHSQPSISTMIARDARDVHSQMMHQQQPMHATHQQQQQQQSQSHHPSLMQHHGSSPSLHAHFNAYQQSAPNSSLQSQPPSQSRRNQSHQQQQPQSHPASGIPLHYTSAPSAQLIYDTPAHLAQQRDQPQTNSYADFAPPPHSNQHQHQHPTQSQQRHDPQNGHFLFV